MAESNVNITPGSGGPNIDLELVDNGNARQVIVIGDSSAAAKTAPVDAVLGVSVNPMSLPPGAATAAGQTNGTQQTQIVQGGNVALVDAAGDIQADINNQVQSRPSDQCQSVTAATGVGVTVTLPAVAGSFHYITLIEIHKFFTAANAASATPLVVTTTNLPGGLAFTFGQPVGAIGVTDERIYNPDGPIKSLVANTNTTIVCPATVGIIWRANVFYFTAA